MIHPSSLPFLYLFLFIVCASALISNGNIIEETCAKLKKGDPDVINYEFCVAALNSVPESRDADLMTLGQISIDLAGRNATAVMSIIQRLFDDPKVDANIKKYVLADCLVEYSRVSDLVPQATSYYKAKRFEEAKNMVGEIGFAGTMCEDDFNEFKAPSLLPKEDADVQQLSFISLGVISLFIN